MQTTEAKTCEQRGLKTYQVLDAMLAGATCIPEIVQQTGLAYRTVNALVYALEKQGRVEAHDYAARRCAQKFEVLHYDAFPSKQKPRINLAHPACVFAQKRVQDGIQVLNQAMFFRPVTTQASAWA
jgi:predicted transcriptional regulator